MVNAASATFTLPMKCGARKPWSSLPQLAARRREVKTIPDNVSELNAVKHKYAHDAHGSVEIDVGTALVGPGKAPPSRRQAITVAHSAIWFGGFVGSPLALAQQSRDAMVRQPDRGGSRAEDTRRCWS